MKFQISLLILALAFASGCKRKEEGAPARPRRPVTFVEGAEAKVAEHLAQGRLCRRVFGTALAVGRPMCAETAKVLSKPPELLDYYAAMMALEGGDLESARKGFSMLASSIPSPSDMRDMAQIWEAASKPGGALPKPDPTAASRLASEAGRARAFLRSDLREAERLCAGALKSSVNPAGRQALCLNYAIVLLAQGKADEAHKALEAVSPQLPIDECEVEKIKLPGRDLMRTLTFYDPALLKCWADYHFLKAVELGENALQPRAGLDVAAALLCLGRADEAERRVKAVCETPALSPRDRLAALALHGQALWALGEKDAARKKWDEMGAPSEEAVTFLLQTYADTPGLPVEVVEGGISLGRETLKRLRQKESEYSERRFRERHLDLFWAMGWACLSAAMQRAASGDLARASEHLANAEEIGNRLYEESSRFDLDKNPPIFLAELADVYLLNVLALGRGNAYLEDMLRYMYDENMLPKVLPAAWQVREYAQMLYALRDLSARAEARPAPLQPASPSMYKSLMAAGQPAAPSSAEAPRAAPRRARLLAVIALILACGCIVVILLVRRHRRRREIND